MISDVTHFGRDRVLALCSPRKPTEAELQDLFELEWNVRYDMHNMGEEDEILEDLTNAIQTSLIAVFDEQPDMLRSRMMQVCWFPKSQRGWYTTYVWEGGKLSAVTQAVNWSEYYAPLPAKR